MMLVLDNDFGANLLKARRQELNLMQREIATALGYKGPNFVTLVENGRASVPLDKLPRLIKAYQMTPEMYWVICFSYFKNMVEAFHSLFGLDKEKLEMPFHDFEKVVSKSASKMKRFYNI